MNEFVTAYAFYRAHGSLPCAGGVMDQACTFVDASQIVGQRLDEIEREELRSKGKG